MAHHHTADVERAASVITVQGVRRSRDGGRTRARTWDPLIKRRIMLQENQCLIPTNVPFNLD